MSATAVSSMFYGLGLLGVAIVVLVTHISTQQTLRALTAAMDALATAIEKLK